VSAAARGFRVERAGVGDDAALRALLRERPMDGAIRLSLEREPSFAQAQEIEGDRHHTVIVRDRHTESIVGMGTRSVREVWIDGEPARVGYLGALRAAAGRRGLVRLAAGYRGIADTHASDELPFDITSVVADNRPARRMLERGLPGMPSYTPICEYRTLLIPTALPARRIRTPSPVSAGDDDLAEIAVSLRRNLRRYQLAPVWSAEALRDPGRSRGLSAGDFFLIRDGGRVVGCAALWDQREFKQAVVRGYAPWLGRARPALNVLLRAVRRPRLPAAGSALPLAFVSHLAVDGDAPELAAPLIEALRRAARQRGIELLAIGYASDHPLLPSLRRLAYRTYASCIYRVDWPGAQRSALPAGTVHLEVATL
jgi:hypothetical protein